MPHHPLLVVDGMNLAWRAACGFPARITTRSGVDITAAFGFFALLRKTHREGFPNAEIVVAFDAETAHNPRRETFDRYKPWMPAPSRTPFEWIPAIQDGLNALSIPWSDCHTYEADDHIATVIATAQPRSAVIMSADHDFVQLVGRRVRLLTPRRLFKVGDVFDRYGVHPRQWCDFRALTGDPSDNIPGIRGIGPTRARYVLHRGRTLDNARIPDTWWGRRIVDEHDAALRWREIIRLRPDQETTITPVDSPTPELPKAADVCRVLGLWDL